MSEVDVRMVRARSHLIQEHPFFGALAMRLTVVERNDIETMATDGTFLFYARAFLDKITASLILFAVAHEVMHCALGHHTRRGSRDHKLWNVACDYVVNWMLKQAGFTVPDWALCDQAYADLGVEQVYRMLEQQQQQQQQQPQDQPEAEEDDAEQDNPYQGDFSSPSDGNDDDNEEEEEECGSNGQNDSAEDESSESDADDGTSTTSPGENADDGAGGSSTAKSENEIPSGSADGTSTPSPDDYAPAHGDPGGCGEVLDAAPEHDEAANAEAADEWQVYTRQAANVARRAGEGNLPGFIEEVVETLNDPQVDWRDVLRRFVDPSATKDYSWTMPNRRYLPLGFYTPGMISDGINHVAIVIDSSGSVDSVKLQKFGSETQAMLDDGAIDKVTVVICDDIVHRTEEYVRGEEIDFTIQGRGGTDFAPAFAWLNENTVDLSAVIYFTDLECSSFGEQPICPVLWTVYGYDPRATQRLMDQVPFGECMEVTE